MKKQVADNKIYQVAIPAVLTGLYKFTRIDENNQAFVNNENGKCMYTFFGDNTNDVINKVADVSGLPAAETQTEMEEITVASLSRIT